MNGNLKRFLIIFRNSFLAGIAVILPIWVTVIVVKFLVNQVNRIFLNPVASLLKNTFGWAHIEPLLFVAKIIVFFIIIGGIALLGMAMRILIVRQLVNFGEGILFKIPLVRNIYKAIQQLSHAFLIKKQSVFHNVVLIEYPRPGIYSIGFVTSDTRGEAQEVTKESLINVFVPTTPNPTSGYFVMVPDKDVTQLSMSVEEGFKLIISGGAVMPHFESDQSS